VVLHGMGDASSNEGMRSLCGSVEEEYPGTHVLCSSTADGAASMKMRLDDQIAAFAAEVASDPELKHGFNAVGLSQGGLVLRGYLERGSGPPIGRLVTVSTPHAGIGACPEGAVWALLCLVFKLDPYGSPTVFSDYWKDVSGGREAYLSRSRWLADANNERDSGASTSAAMARRRAAMQRLEAYVLVHALNDTRVVPRESSTHAFWAWGGKGGPVVPMRQSAEYRNDSLGLRSLDEAGRLHTLPFLGDHLDFEPAFWRERVLSWL